jgi:hypothetical protein
MGRNKIKIERITNERTRLATFNKRKNGLVKKAMELAILCGCEVALIVIGNNKLTQYSSSDMDQLLLRYTDGGFDEPHADPLTSDDYPKLFGKKNKAASLPGTCSSQKESPAKKARIESPTPLQGAPSHPASKPLVASHHEGRTSPSVASVPTLVPRGPSPPLGVKPVSPPAPFAPGQGARLAAPQQQLASSYPSPMGYPMVGAGYPATRTGQFPSQQSSSSPSRSSIVPSLYSAPSSTTSNSSTPGGRISPPHRGSFGSVSPTFDAAKPQSPHSDPPTPPGSGGHQYAEEMRSRASAGRLHQEQQFTQKLNKKNLSLAIPDTSAVAVAGFPGSSSSGHSRHTTYTPGFTGLNVPSSMPFMGEPDMQHSAILPSPSSFFAGETPGSHPESGHYLPTWGNWMTPSPRHHEPIQERFLSRDLNLALHDGTLHQFSLGKQLPYSIGDKRKANDLLRA